jgi:type IV pilus assembly protein PilW
MIAMTLGLVLIAGLFFIYVNTSQSSRAHGALALMQENARYAFEIMALDIRQAGFTGTRKDDVPTTVVNPSALSGLMDLFGTPLIGYEGANPPNVCTTANTAPCYQAGTLLPDSLTVVRPNTENKFSIASHATPVFTLPSPWPTSNPPEAGEIFVAADYTHTAIFQVEAVNTGARTVSYGPAGAAPGNSGTDLGAFYGGTAALSLYRLNGVSYYIGRNPVGEPALYRQKLSHSGTTANSTAEELVQGIGNMQITYGVDTDPDAASPLGPGDGSVNGYWTATQVNAGTDGTLNIQSAICNNSVSDHWQCVVSVRVTLTLVSGQNEKVGTTGDRLLRKTFTNTIAIRNRLP